MATIDNGPNLQAPRTYRMKSTLLYAFLLFPFSLDGEARDWLDKEPPRSILTWDDLVSKFINQYFPPSKTTYYRNEIITFYQKPNEAFNEAWERFKGLLRQCPHHGFSELHQLDTFYNSLNSNDQDALDSAAGGNFLDKMPQEGLAIIESKSKVRYSRSRANDSRVSTDAPLSNSSPSNNSFDMQQIAASLEDKMTIKMNQMMNQMKALVVTTPAPVKAVEEAIPIKLQFKFFTKQYHTKPQETKPRLLQLVVVFHTWTSDSTSGGEKEVRVLTRSTLDLLIRCLQQSFTHFDPIVLLIPTLTPFDESDFLLIEEAVLQDTTSTNLLVCLSSDSSISNEETLCSKSNRDARISGKVVVGKVVEVVVTGV
ncbi:reverse transcriptase domain-containing protein [Tanacetum coccineum]